MQPSKYSRRDFLNTTTMTASAAIFSPHARGAELASATSGLNADELTTIAAYGETLAPGARAAGIASFVGEQLVKPVSDCLLMIRYLGVPPPYLSLYKTWLASLQTASQQRHQNSFAALTAQQQKTLADDMANDKVKDWPGPPASFFHFVLRADATDLVYGTVEGFKRLELPYLAHIPPSSDW